MATQVMLIKQKWYNEFMPLPCKEELKCIILHNFSNKEISLILSAVKTLYPEKIEKQKLVFSKTTKNSRSMTVDELIEDVSDDHLYLLENPPQKDKPMQTQ